MQGAPHILIVDDHREIRDLVSRALTKEGFRVSTAADGRAMQKMLADGRMIRADAVTVAEAPPSKRVAGATATGPRRAGEGAAGAAAALARSNPSSAADEATRNPMA